MKKILLVFISLNLFFGAFAQNKAQLSIGFWRATLETKGGELPFSLEISKNSDNKTYAIYVINGEEKLKQDAAYFKNDSLHIPMNLYDSELIGKVMGENIAGIWRKKRSNGTFVEAKFKAEFGKKYRFFENENNAINGVNSKLIAEKYRTVFVSENGKDTTSAIGIFSNQGNIAKGSFLTTTGDYRYLAGTIQEDSLYLSCFDGSHAFLFKARIDAAQKIVSGQFWSNGTSLENWIGFEDATAELPDEKSLTFLKEGYSSVNFSFINENKKMITFPSEKYKGKVVIIQIMGSWCPNCMDESRFLAPWYKKNKNRGVEIIGLSYEKYTDLAISLPKIKAMKQRFGLEYEVLFAGINDQQASKTLPMINKIMGYPTTIFVDKKGKVREIHTGFSGPGTGKYYDKFVSDFNRLMDKLVAE